jgi:hypothetical protein
MSFGGPATTSIASATDVALNNPTNSQVLGYNGGTSKWENQTVVTGGSSDQPGIVQLESFPGASDDAKLDAALTYAAAQTYIPTIQFPARTLNLSKSRVPFSGMKLIGPAGHGPKNLELASGKYTNGKVRLTCGSGSSSWFVAGSQNLYDIYIGNMAFHGNATSQFWEQSAGTLYACQFHSLTHYGFKHVFGSPASKALFTQVIFSGHWTNIGAQDTQFMIGGSDNALWRDGYINIDNAGIFPGRYQIIFSSLSNTSLGYVYLTCSGGTRGLLVEGSASDVTFFGGTYEGYKSYDPAPGNLVRVTGGNVAFYGTRFGQAMGSPDASEHGFVEVTSGNVLLHRPIFDPGSTGASVPLAYVSGGKLEVQSAVGTTRTPGVQRVGGTLVNDSSVTVL